MVRRSRRSPPALRFAAAISRFVAWPQHLGTAMKSYLLVTGTLSLLIVPCWSADHGQIPNDLPDHVRSWFKSVKSHNGVPCCDITDVPLGAQVRTATRCPLRASGTRFPPRRSSMTLATRSTRRLIGMLGKASMPTVNRPFIFVASYLETALETADDDRCGARAAALVGVATAGPPQNADPLGTDRNSFPWRHFRTRALQQ